MDILTHIFFVLILLYAIGYLKVNDLTLLAVSFSGAIADFDVFLGVHKTYLHSPLLVTLIAAIMLYFGRNTRYHYILVYACIFLYSHIALDFFSSGVPLIYPFSDICMSINFPLILSIDNGIAFENWRPEIATFHAYKLQGESLYAFSEFGIVSVVAYIIIEMSRICRRDKYASINSKRRNLRIQRGEEHR